MAPGTACWQAAALGLGGGLLPASGNRGGSTPSSSSSSALACTAAEGAGGGTSDQPASVGARRQPGDDNSNNCNNSTYITGKAVDMSVYSRYLLRLASCACCILHGCHCPRKVGVHGQPNTKMCDSELFICCLICICQSSLLHPARQTAFCFFSTHACRSWLLPPTSTFMLLFKLLNFKNNTCCKRARRSWLLPQTTTSACGAHTAACCCGCCAATATKHTCWRCTPLTRT